MIQDRDCGDENDAILVGLSAVDWERIAQEHAVTCARILREIAAFSRRLCEMYEQSVGDEPI